MIEFIYGAWNIGDFAVGVFVDLRKAFDKVDHVILFSKLHRYGVRGTSLSLIGSYLSGKVQRVRIGNFCQVNYQLYCWSATGFGT